MSRDESHRIVPACPVGVLWLTEQWEIAQANESLLEMLEVDSFEELRGVSSIELVAPEFRNALIIERAKRRQGEASSYESVLLGRKGTRRKVLVSGTPITSQGEFRGAIVTYVDVTQLRAAEGALEKSLQRYRALVNTLGDGVLVIARNGEILEANESASRILGVPPQSFRTLFALADEWRIFDEQGKELRAEDLPASVTLISGRPCRNTVLRLVRPDQTALWLSVNTEPMFHDLQPFPETVVVSFHDITALKQSHHELSVREARLARLLDAVPDLLFLMSTDGVYLDYRASKPELLFFPPEKFLHRSMEELLPHEVLEPCLQGLQRALETNRPQTVEYSSDILGTRQYFEARYTPFDADTVLLIVRDITEARLAEQKLRQQEQERLHLARLGALGEMVAGISHEINQPLHAIANFAAASLNLLDAKGPTNCEQVREWLQKIAKQSFRASEIVKRFRQFSGRDAKVSDTPISELIHESLELAAGELRRRNVQPEVQNKAGNQLFRCDRIQLEQVLVNFLVNAAEALECRPPPERRLLVTSRLVGNQLICEVTDNGCGLPDVTPHQLFDAFFTTKPNGLGLGLAISRTIIEAAGGRIYAHRNDGEGAVFGFEVPPALE